MKSAAFRLVAAQPDERPDRSCRFPSLFPSMNPPPFVRTPLNWLVAGVCLWTVSLAAAAPGEWQALFDGKTLKGWEANESPASWRVEDGALVCRGPRSHLFYVGDVANHEFKNFELTAEVLTLPGSNSGIYFHTHLGPEPWPPTGYECQVINSSRVMDGGYSEYKMTASIYAVRSAWLAPARDHTWFEYRIKVSGRTIQTFIDGELICQYTEGPTAWRGQDKPGRHLASGTFALQGHDPKSEVHFRNIKVRQLPADAPSLDQPMADHDLDDLITQFSDQNVALIDLGILPGTEAGAEVQAVDARKYGVAYGFQFPREMVDLAKIAAGSPVVVLNDRDHPPSVAMMKAAKANGAKLAFSSGGVSRLDPDRLKRRLLAMREAGLEWRDIWIPGK